MPADFAEIIREGVKAVTDKTGAKIEITDAQIKLISEGLIELFNVINSAAIKKANAAGQAGADGITTVEQANAILKALADKEAK